MDCETETQPVETGTELEIDDLWYRFALFFNQISSIPQIFNHQSKIINIYSGMNLAQT